MCVREGEMCIYVLRVVESECVTTRKVYCTNAFAVLPIVTPFISMEAIVSTPSICRYSGAALGDESNPGRSRSRTTVEYTQWSSWETHCCSSSLKR